MIYTYKHLVHPIELFHTEIAYFFEQLFKHTPKKYDEKLLLRKDFINIVNESSSRLKGNLVRITEEYYLLTAADKVKLKRAFKTNCNIIVACSDKRVHIIKYDEISNTAFVKLLKDFLTMLWEEYPQNQLLENKCGTIQSHFTAFLNPKHQKALVCPFCGLHSLKPAKGIYRNAYDHFIPKAMYPFVSINFQNLFPVCHECNSDEKKEKDTLYDLKTRRKVLHPYDINYNPEELAIDIKPSEPYNAKNLKTLLQDINWEYAITLAGKTDARLTTWNDIYAIKRRYQEYILTYQTTWFEDILSRRYKEDMKDGLTFQRFREKLMDDTHYQKYSPLGMLRFIYFNFLFNLPAFETKLKAVV